MAARTLPVETDFSASSAGATLVHVVQVQERLVDVGYTVSKLNVMFIRFLHV